MRASEFRAWGRASLAGKWGTAVAVCLVGGLLGGGIDLVSEVLNSEVEGVSMEWLTRENWIMMVTITVVSIILALVIGGAIILGMSTFFLNLVNRREARFGDLFSQFHRLWAGICMMFLQSFFIMLWTLLLIVPGIVAGYRYAMMPYLMAEFPELTARQAMAESKRLMDGNKWRLFCLHLSFIGWALLSALTLFIGDLWLTPYRMASEAAFYMEITGRGPNARQTPDSFDLISETNL